MSARMELTDINGVKWVGDGDPDALTDDQRAQVDELLSEFTTLTYLSVVIRGTKHYFNPKHIIAAALVEEQS